MPAPRKHIEGDESSLLSSPKQAAPNPVPALPSGNLSLSRESKGHNVTFKDPNQPEGTGQTSECFRLRHVQIEALLKDGTLGLLLHGTSVVGFCSEEVADQGWLVGDQIVEINGKRVSAFDEFLERFVAAQDQGFPIVFSVLRRETPEVPETKDPLDSFFNQTQFADLANQLKNKFGPQPKKVATLQPSSSFGETSILENPYIQALRKRRSELSRSPEGWSEDYQSQSLAAKMASERGDALATLSKDSTDKPGSYERSSRSTPTSFDLFSCITAFRPCREKEAGAEEFQTTPRMDCDFEKVSTPNAVVLTARAQGQRS